MNFSISRRTTKREDEIEKFMLVAIETKEKDLPQQAGVSLGNYNRTRHQQAKSKKKQTFVVGFLREKLKGEEHMGTLCDERERRIIPWLKKSGIFKQGVGTKKKGTTAVGTGN